MSCMQEGSHSGASLPAKACQGPRKPGLILSQQSPSHPCFCRWSPGLGIMGKALSTRHSRCHMDHSDITVFTARVPVPSQLQ